MPMQNKWVKWFAVGILLMLFLVIRGLERRLFYDPFTVYFKNEYLSGPLPEYESLKLGFWLSLRYGLNTLISLTIIGLLFGKIAVRFCGFLYLIFFVLLMSGFFIVLEIFGSDQNFTLFYLRRFLIQPLFLLIFVPALFYQQRLSKK